MKRLLVVLYDRCPNLYNISLCGTRITDKFCDILLNFYNSFLGKDSDGNVIIQKAFPKWQTLDVTETFIGVRGHNVLQSMEMWDIKIEHEDEDAPLSLF